MHILFLTDNFPPEGNAPATRTYEHAKCWVQAGHAVTVITCAPNFPEGKVFPGYQNRWLQKESLEGINVWRVKTYITANEGFLRRSLDYMSFMITGAFAGIFVKKPDIVVATSPQFFNAIGGWLLAALRRKPFIFELRDIWPASITAVGAMKGSWVIRMLEKIEMFLYRRADAIVSVTESFRQELIERGVEAEKISVVLNGVDLATYNPINKDKELAARYNLTDKFVAGYIGTHGLAHGLEHIVAAAERLKERQDLVFLFAGGGAAQQQVEELVKAKGLNNVRVLGRQDKSLMPKLWSLCDVSLVHLKDAELFTTVIPSKIFESMGMGLPIVISVPKGEATSIIEQYQAGVVVPPEDSAALADVLLSLSEDEHRLKKLAQHSVSAAAHFDRQHLASKMLQDMLRVQEKHK